MRAEGARDGKVAGHEVREEMEQDRGGSYGYLISLGFILNAMENQGRILS